MPKQPKTLKELMALIAETWKCDRDRYPTLKGSVTSEEKLRFTASHSLFHLNKSIGKLAAALEDHDHNASDLALGGNVKVAALKIFVNALKLAEEAGLSAEDILALAPGIVS